MFRILIVVMLVAVGACGVDASAGDESSTSEPPNQTTTSTLTATTSTGAPTTSTLGTTTTVPEYDLILEGGTDEIPEVSVLGPGRFTYAPGDAVRITVLSSVTGDLHLHGYDLLFPLAEGEVTEVTLTADIPGIFEAELESSHMLIFELEVTP